tara:strand:- start:1321 stop:2232 length:912 start_codon:yes stop_codon:yes gene_type:complete
MKKTYNVESTFNEMRIDRWLRNQFGQIPQGLIEKNLRNGKIKLNKKKVKSSTKLMTNDKIDVYSFIYKKNIVKSKIKFTPSFNIVKENENLIIENNEDFIVINKRSGLAVQGGTKSKKNLVDIFSKSDIFQNTKPFSVHRLDKDTSGIFILAKNRKTAQLLTSLFRLRKVHKTYLALCHGEVSENKGILKNDLVKYEGKKKITENATSLFKILDKNSNCSLVKLKPITGRKHQLRKQMLILGNSILGDKKYNFGKKNIISNKNLMLHSYEIKFIINDKKYTFRASLPDYFKKMLKTKRLHFSN